MINYEKTEIITRENIKKLRKLNGYSVGQMAKFIGKEEEFYKEYEDSNLYKRLTVSEFEKICDLFGVTPVMVMGEEDIEPIDLSSYAEDFAVEDMNAIRDINRIALNLREMNRIAENEGSFLDFVRDSLEDKLQELAESELGVLLLKRSEVNDEMLLDVLGTMLKNEKAVAHFVGSKCYVYHILPLYYVDRPSDMEDVDLTESRASAVWNLFNRWTAAGYNKNNAKKPYGSKAFNKYMTEIEFLTSDYMLLLVDPEENKERNNEICV